MDSIEERIEFERLRKHAEILSGLKRKFQPHPKQVQIGAALFLCQYKDIFVQAGRNFGKTMLVSYLLWRWAKTYPGSENYYFAPFMKQAREIVWATRIIQELGPREWIDPPNNTEMRIRFKNGSFIKCDGSDNIDAYRGVKPRGLVVFDEFKDFRPEFFDAFDPNRAAHNSPLIIIGTPPAKKNHFSSVRENFKTDSQKIYFHAPSRQNPYLSADWLETKRRELIARGEEDVWQREYEALEILGGKAKIFPMLKRSLIVPHEELMQRLVKDRKRLEWIWFADPAAASVFAVLFCAHNPYTKEIYILDEIYEQDQAKMTVKQIGHRILSAKEDIEPKHEWRGGYDEAATWFANEMLDNFGESLEASQKAANDKQAGLTLIKDIILSGKLFFSDRCVKCFGEFDNYYKDDSGNIPKKDDHTIDILRYILGALYYSLPEAKSEQEIKDTKRTKLGDDFPQFKELI